MIYLKRTLWVLGYPIMVLLASVIFIVTCVFIGFECLYLYIKNGDTQGYVDCFEWCIKFIEWYIDIEPKERK